MDAYDVIGIIGIFVGLVLVLATLIGWIDWRS
jgi:hypothetical protein